MHGSATMEIGTDRVVTWPLGDQDIQVAAGWLAEERNARWLDFGSPTGMISPLGLKLLAQREQHCIWVYGPAGERRPAGLVALGNIQSRFRTAEAWVVLGAKELGPRDLTIMAACKLLTHAFGPLALHTVYAWTVEANRGGRRILERCGFRYAGKLRESHRLGDKTYDRLWFDLLAHEFHGYQAL
jgi:RimJ/RimL family protein N-acetyltransferase